jgi:hypothetical protein
LSPTFNVVRVFIWSEPIAVILAVPICCGRRRLKAGGMRRADQAARQPGRAGESAVSSRALADGVGQGKGWKGLRYPGWKIGAQPAKADK